MSFDTFTLFDFVALQGQAATARVLGVSRAMIGRFVHGERRVSTGVHDACQRVWAEAYNLRGTVEESRRKHEAWEPKRAEATDGSG